jgi:hypothetical protein
MVDHGDHIGRRHAALDEAHQEIRSLRTEEERLRREHERVRHQITVLEGRMTELLSVIYGITVPAPTRAPERPAVQAERVPTVTPRVAAAAAAGAASIIPLTPVQRRRAGSVEMVRAALGQLGGSADRPTLLTEIRKQDAKFGEGKLGALLQRSQCFVFGVDEKWRVVDGAVVLTSVELGIQRRREEIAAGIEQLGGQARLADLLDLLQRKHGAQRITLARLNHDLRRGRFTRAGHGIWGLPGEAGPFTAGPVVHPSTRRKLQALEAVMHELGGRGRTSAIRSALERALGAEVVASDLSRLLKVGPFHRERHGWWAVGLAPNGAVGSEDLEQLTSQQRKRRELAEIVKAAIEGCGGRARRDQILAAVRAKVDADYTETRLSAFMVRTPLFRCEPDKRWCVVLESVDLGTEGERRIRVALYRQRAAVRKVIRAYGGRATRGQIWHALRGKTRDFDGPGAVGRVLGAGGFDLDHRTWSIEDDEAESDDQSDGSSAPV